MNKNVSLSNVNYSMLAHLYSFSTLEKIPIEVYLTLKNSINEGGSLDNNIFKPQKLEFLTLINGHYEREVLRLAFDSKLWSRVIDLGSQFNNIEDYISNEDIFKIKIDNDNLQTNITNIIQSGKIHF